MSETPMICMWMGRRVDELSRDELLEVVQQLGRQLEAERESHRSYIDMQRMFAEARAAREAAKPRLHRIFDALT